MRTSRRMGFGALTWHMWDVYALVTTNTTAPVEENYSATWNSGLTDGYFSSGYYFSTSTYLFNLSSGYTGIANYSPTTFIGKYAVLSSSSPYNASEVYYISSATRPVNSPTILTISKRIYAATTTTYSKGTATGNAVFSTNENAYPDDGKQGSYWYVKHTLSFPVVWDVYDIVYASTPTDTLVSSGTALMAGSRDDSGIVCASYGFESSTNTYIIPSGATSWNLTDVWAEAVSKWLFLASELSTPGHYNKIYRIDYTSTSGTTGTWTALNMRHGVYAGSRGTALGTTVQSMNPNAYPANGAQNGYWYTRQ